MSGPGGVGKSTIVDALVDRDPRLWLSRSWTTRARRDGEPGSAYVFVDRAAFEDRIRAGGFVEWTEFLGNYYGTPTPEVPLGRDLVLEIEVDGARQIKSLQPDAVLDLRPAAHPGRAAAAAGGPGRPPRQGGAAAPKAEDEEPVGMALADHVVVNDDLEQTIKEMLDIIEAFAPSPAARHRGGASPEVIRR